MPPSYLLNQAAQKLNCIRFVSTLFPVWVSFLSIETGRKIMAIAELLRMKKQKIKLKICFGMY
jgi:flagellar motor switch/type III secretory pathway protein FliN